MSNNGVHYNGEEWISLTQRVIFGDLSVTAPKVRIQCRLAERDQRISEGCYRLGTLAKHLFSLKFLLITEIVAKADKPSLPTKIVTDIVTNQVLSPWVLVEIIEGPVRPEQVKTAKRALSRYKASHCILKKVFPVAIWVPL